MRDAYHAPSAIFAEAQLEALARELEHTHPGATGSLREGLSETLTVLRLGVLPTLARTLRITNSIEMTIGPPPKVHGTRDILGLSAIHCRWFGTCTALGLPEVTLNSA